MADHWDDHTYFQDANTDSPKSKRKRTGKSCCVAECCNKNSDGVSIHGFPTNPSLRRQWINFVKTCRADFTAPTANSVICEKHFSADCYPLQYRLREEMGIRVTKKDLLPGSVPTIQKCFTPATSTNGSTIGTDSTVTSVASHSQTTCTVVTTHERGRWFPAQSSQLHRSLG
ncbi:hypothetical protein BaRGS_00020439 [Batillaria attramentaria]|uniref:THAP-type domain-containing protein n=1 Tax=Batillaria attramentaria TaxID=370345 RepID=A0ABD0KM33_9CAEN